MTTACPQRHSADALCAGDERRNYAATLHQQWKPPLAASPVFLRSARRVEGLVGLLQIALPAYQAVERL